MGDKYTIWLEEIGKESVQLVGGKNANLGELRAIGIPAPDGFAITTKACDEFLKSENVSLQIAQYLDQLSAEPENSAQYLRASRKVRDIVEQAAIPTRISESIIYKYNQLCKRKGKADVPVAVRSSGVAEDSSESSYAGQFESFLNVNGRGELLEAVRKCWSSLFTARALSYQKAIGLEHGVGLLGVAVQEMIYARSAGVCFTLHPLTKDTSSIIIEGNWGLGESVVQGLVTPDTYVVDKESLKLIEKRVSKKEKGVGLSSSGTTVIEIPSHKQKSQCLRDEEATKIAGFARSLELHYDAPQDIEWAVSGERAIPDNVFLLQSRPIVSASSGDPLDQIIDGLLNTKGM